MATIIYDDLKIDNVQLKTDGNTKYNLLITNTPDILKLYDLPTSPTTTATDIKIRVKLGMYFGKSGMSDNTRCLFSALTVPNITDTITIVGNVSSKLKTRVHDSDTSVTSNNGTEIDALIDKKFLFIDLTGMVIEEDTFGERGGALLIHNGGKTTRRKHRRPRRRHTPRK